jgi:GrpB-like predicted nucleotidyltransferase (UPF0157 family)
LQPKVKAVGGFVDHVGSTAVPGIAAKPIIDILITLPKWSCAGEVAVFLRHTGYQQQPVTTGERMFFERFPRQADRPAFQIHVTPENSAYGRNMVRFRNELQISSELSRRYGELKQRLAAENPDDLEAYTSGKSHFVGEALSSTTDVFNTDRLLTHQRAELDRSQSLQPILTFVQLLVAAVAGTSVFFDDNTALLNLAIIGALLIIAWVFIWRIARTHRAAGDQARRLVLLKSGLGQTISANHQLRVYDEFRVSLEGRPLVREEDYFASRAPVGYRRLAELLEESAFWTRDLQRTSAYAMAAVILMSITLPLLAFWTSTQCIELDSNISFARVLMALVVFLLSSDVIGAALGYRDAAKSLADILQRIESAEARQFPQADVLLLMSDYNAAVEAAPVALPGIYKLRRTRLVRMWYGYLDAKSALPQ